MNRDTQISAGCRFTDANTGMKRTRVERAGRMVCHPVSLVQSLSGLKFRPSVACHVRAGHKHRLRTPFLHLREGRAGIMGAASDGVCLEFVEWTDCREAGRTPTLRWRPGKKGSVFYIFQMTTDKASVPSVIGQTCFPSNTKCPHDGMSKGCFAYLDKYYAEEGQPFSLQRHYLHVFLRPRSN